MDKNKRCKKIVSWFTLYSRGLAEVSIRLSSHIGVAGGESNRVGLRDVQTAGRKEQDGSMALEFIDFIEMQAFS